MAFLLYKLRKPFYFLLLMSLNKFHNSLRTAPQFSFNFAVDFSFEVLFYPN
jgi:hypothetical protein